MLENTQAISLDIDDVVVLRQNAVRIAGMLNGRKSHPFHPPRYDLYKPYEGITIEPITRAISSNKLSLKDQMSLHGHAVRKINPDIVPVLDNMQTNGVVIYGNTGRENSQPWIEMTEHQLRELGIRDYFESIFFTPVDLPTRSSKAAGIEVLRRKYSFVIHADDDPRTIFHLASIYPEGSGVQFYLLHYGPTGLLYSKRELARFPNVTRINSIRELAI